MLPMYLFNLDAVQEFALKNKKLPNTGSVGPHFVAVVPEQVLKVTFVLVSYKIEESELKNVLKNCFILSQGSSHIKLLERMFFVC